MTFPRSRALSHALLACAFVIGTSAYAADAVSNNVSHAAASGAGASAAALNADRRVVHADASQAQLARGAYLTKAADCIACHTAKKAHPFAGGVPFATPFGTVFSTNITPDVRNGIGSFSDQDFIDAVREGVSKGGKRLYPAMPYTSYTQLTDDDILAIRAYLKTVQPIDVAPPANTMPFPFNQRWAMMFWNLFNFSSGRFQPDASKSAEWNRGAYLVTALGHCQECHTPRNVMEGLSKHSLAGAQLGNWTAFNITPDANAGIGTWRDTDLRHYLQDGVAPGKANAAGPMAEVVENSTRYLSQQDLQAIAVYLKSVPAQNGGEMHSRFDAGHPLTQLTDIRGQSAVVPVAAGAPASGKVLYVANCASCHGWSGRGIGDASAGGPYYPSLIHNSVVGTGDPKNLTMVILHGVTRETNHGHVVMPGFDNQLSNADVVSLVNYVSAQFGSGATTTADKVQKLR